jgi:hypothetical protein
MDPWGILLVQIVGFAFVLWYIRRTKLHFIRQLQLQRKRNWHSASLLAAVGNDIPPLPFMDEWIASPDFVSEVVRAIRLCRPGLVVELGSGVSTVFLADAIRKNGHGRLVSFDHSTDFIEATRRLLEVSTLDQWCELRHAPLEPTKPSGMPWYSIGKFSDLSGIGILVVDGPPAASQPYVRATAAAVLGKQMAGQARIYLDDAARDGESTIVKEWCKAFPSWRAEYLSFEKGCYRIDVGQVPEDSRQLHTCETNA